MGAEAELFKALGGQLTGTVVLLEGEDTVPAWNALYQDKNSPLTAGTVQAVAVAKVKSKQDVVKCVEFALANKIRIQGRGNGHHYGANFNAPGGMVIDLSEMKCIDVDGASKSAIVQPGACSGDVYRATVPHKLHFPGGHCTHAGLSGFILGGGLGWGARHLGAGCDNVLALEVVLATEEGCKLTMVTAETHPELFWGLKGAGCFLAVVTEFHLRLHDVDDKLLSASALFPVACMEQVCAKCQELMDSSRYPLSTEPGVAVFTQPQTGQRVCQLSVTAFEDVDGAKASIEQVKSFLPEARIGDAQCGYLPYLEAMSLIDPAWTWPNLAIYSTASFINADKLGPELYKVLHKLGETMFSPSSIVLFVPGAGPVEGEASPAFAYRNHYYVTTYGMWERTPKGPIEDGDVGVAAWADGGKEALAPFISGSYLNETMLDKPGQVADCFPPDVYLRLKELKASVDPHGLLMAL